MYQKHVMYINAWLKLYITQDWCKTIFNFLSGMSLETSNEKTFMFQGKYTKSLW